MKVSDDYLEDSTEDFAAMLEESFKKEKSEKFTEGKIVSIADGMVSVDVGEKTDGKFPVSEITDFDGNLKYKVGDSISVVVSGFRSEQPIVSHKNAIKKTKQKEFIDNGGEELIGSVVDGKILKHNKGGYIVEDKDGVEFFMPISLALFTEKEAGQAALGKAITANIIKIDSKTKSIIISRKKYLNDKRKAKRELVKNVLTSEEPIEGVVKKIVSYGIFVEAGGIDGLVHFTEISHKGAVNPAQYYQVGDVVTVKAIEYNKDKKRTSFSIKAACTDPWETVKQELEPGDAVKALVSNIENYGAFLDLGNDIEGFLHISEISWKKNIKHPSEILEVGQEVTAEIIEIDLKNKRLRLSMKRLMPKPFDEFKSKKQIGEVLKGTITGITDFGAFVKLGEIEGLLHNEDFSWDRSVTCKDNLKVGDEIDVKILRIDSEKEKVSLSVKELGLNPVEQYGVSNPVGTLVKGTVRDIKDFGVFVRLAPGVDALIRQEDLFPKKLGEVEIGEEIEASITLFDPPKIRLSQRRAQKDKERNLIKDINNQNSGFNNAFREKLRS